MGKNKFTGANGLKMSKNFERSKSAPAGYGVLEEDSETFSKKIKISIISDLDEKKKKRKKRKRKKKYTKSKGVGWPYGDFSIGSTSGDSNGGGDGGGE